MKKLMNWWIRTAVGFVIIAIAVLWSRCPDPMSSRSATMNTHKGTNRMARSSNVDPLTQPRGAIVGSVRDVRGLPIVGATVCADVARATLRADLRSEPRCATTDASGAYKLFDLYAAMYAVTATARTFRPETSRFQGEESGPWFRLDTGETKTIDLVLRPGGAEVSGFVLDVSGGPVPHAWVQAQAAWGSYVYSPFVETDKNGRFSLWTYPGLMMLRASADGYSSVEISGRAPGVFKLLVTPEASLGGAVIDARTGAPVAGVQVLVYRDDSNGGDAQLDQTDAGGRFRARRLSPGRYIVSAKTDDGFGHTEGSILLGLAQEVDGVIVKLFAASRITGKVVVAGSPPSTCSNSQVTLRRIGGEGLVSARTEEDGTVIAPAVLPGTYAPSIFCPGGKARAKYDQIVVTDKHIDGLVWHVDPRGTATIRGKLVTKQGAAVADASISAVASDAGTDAGHAFSRWDGSFELTGLLRGTYRIQVRMEGPVYHSEPILVTIEAGATVDKDLVVDGGGVIQGTVVDSRGKPVENAIIRYAGKLTGYRELGDLVRTDAIGTFTTSRLPADEYQVTAHREFELLRKPGTSDDRNQGEPVIVKAGQTTVTELVVEARSGSIKGTVVDANNNPVSDAYVASAREPDDASAKTRETRFSWGQSTSPVLTAFDGTFMVTDLLPGTYTLRAYRRGGGEVIAANVKTGASIRMQIKSTGSIEGVATYPGGEIDDVITISLADLGSGFQREDRFYRTDGRFALRDVPQGSFQLLAETERSSKQIEITLGEGEKRTGIAVVLEQLVTLTGRVVEISTEKAAPNVRVGAGRVLDWDEMRSQRANDAELMTDANGRFTLTRIPTGQIEIRVYGRNSGYGSAHAIRHVTGAGTVDVGNIGVVKQRVKEGDPVGDLGVTFAQQSLDTPRDKQELKVAAIDSNGAAARTGLQVGDVLKTIDGVDVTGANQDHAWTLMRAAPGTKLTIVVTRGVSVEITLRAP